MVLAWNERGSSIKDTKPLAVITGEGKSVMCSQSFLVFSLPVIHYARLLVFSTFSLRPFVISPRIGRS